MTIQATHPAARGKLGTLTMSPNVLFQELDDEAILLNLASEHYYGLDDVGMRMWQLLDEHGSVATVMARLLAEYDVDEATLRYDLAQFINQLNEAGLVIAKGVGHAA